MCGVSFELAQNNIISNVMTFQTKATTIPFTSGSDEPVLGSKLQGATSGAVGRVRRIELDSGTWGGGDAAGTMHLVEETGTFNSSETIQNVTVIVPFNSGSSKPAQGDILTGATSGATGTVLWASLQSATDWSAGTGTGFFYLIDVTGNFNGTENINNTTTSESNIATQSSAETPVDTDIATTNGAQVSGNSKGFQKYGVGLNIRNEADADTADSYNVISGLSSFNNDLSPYEDRGLNNILNGFNQYVSTIISNKS